MLRFSTQTLTKSLPNRPVNTIGSFHLSDMPRKERERFFGKDMKKKVQVAEAQISMKNKSSSKLLSQKGINEALNMAEENYKHSVYG